MGAYAAVHGLFPFHFCMFVTQQRWAAKWWLLPPCSPTVQSYPCRSSLNRVWFHRNCWTNSFRKRCTASFLLQKMRALATRRKSWRPSSTGAVGAFCKITVWAHWVHLGLGRLTSRGISKTLPIFGNMAFTHLQKLQAEQDPIATSESRLILVLLGKRA